MEKTVASNIVGRSREKRVLHDLVNSKKAEFVAIYGRHRIGKTYLIKNFIGSQSCVFFHVTGVQNSPTVEQLEEFANQIGETFYRGASISKRTRWRDAFEDLSHAIANSTLKCNN